MNDDTTQPTTTHDDVDAMFQHLNTAEPLPLALVRMFPHGRAAHLAAQVLDHAGVIELALAEYAESRGHGSLDRNEASHAAGIVQGFRHALAQETAVRNDAPPCAPLTGTSGRSIVHTIADAISAMPEPGEEDGGWRYAARKQVEKTGLYYVQTWKRDATYYAYTAAAQDGKG